MLIPGSLKAMVYLLVPFCMHLSWIFLTYSLLRLAVLPLCLIIHCTCWNAARLVCLDAAKLGMTSIYMLSSVRSCYLHVIHLFAICGFMFVRVGLLGNHLVLCIVKRVFLLKNCMLFAAHWAVSTYVRVVKYVFGSFPVSLHWFCFFTQVHKRSSCTGWFTRTTSMTRDGGGWGCFLYRACIGSTDTSASFSILV